jgi:hypothetical protein
VTASDRGLGHAEGTAKRDHRRDAEMTFSPRAHHRAWPHRHATPAIPLQVRPVPYAYGRRSGRPTTRAAVQETCPAPGPAVPIRRAGLYGPLAAFGERSS